MRELNNPNSLYNNKTNKVDQLSDIKQRMIFRLIDQTDKNHKVGLKDVQNFIKSNTDIIVIK